jgi:hypothetical protein
MALSRLNLLRSKNPFEMNPNGQNLCLGHLLLSLAEQKMLLTVPMTLVRVSIQHLYASTQYLTCHGIRVRIRDWQWSSNRGQAPSEFTGRA